MEKAQGGFTLIELVVVIVILGILAATALPKFIDLKSDASTAAVAGVAGALGSAASINFGARTANSTKGVSVANCTDVVNALQGGLPAGYNVVTGAVAAGAAVNCNVTFGSYTGTFQALGIS